MLKETEKQAKRTKLEGRKGGSREKKKGNYEISRGRRETLFAQVPNFLVNKTRPQLPKAKTTLKWKARFCLLKGFFKVVLNR